MYNVCHVCTRLNHYQFCRTFLIHIVLRTTTLYRDWHMTWLNSLVLYQCVQDIHLNRTTLLSTGKINKSMTVVLVSHTWCRLMNNHRRVLVINLRCRVQMSFLAVSLCLSGEITALEIDQLYSILFSLVSLYCIRTSTRNSCIHYTDCWIVKQVDQTVVLLQQSIKHDSIVYTCITYFAMHWSMLFISQFQVNIRLQYLVVISALRNLHETAPRLPIWGRFIVSIKQFQMLGK